MMHERKLYNYKKALKLPFMIQKLWRGFTLENPIELTKVIVFGSTLLALFTVLKPVMWVLGMIKGLKFAGYVLLPFAAVTFWDRIEPDGLKIPTYLNDFCLYIVNFKVSKSVINQNELVNKIEDLVVFARIETDEPFIHTQLEGRKKGCSCVSL